MVLLKKCSRGTYFPEYLRNAKICTARIYIYVHSIYDWGRVHISYMEYGSSWTSVFRDQMVLGLVYKFQLI